jgi:hypothetical protein
MTIPMSRYSCVIVLMLPLLVGMIGGGASQKAHSGPASAYYPLAKGNTWTYRVRSASGAQSSTVKWRVTSVKPSREGIVYQVWPTRSDSDDEAMVLLTSAEGIEELSSHVFVLKSSLSSGEKWASEKTSDSPPRFFEILAVHQPCRAGPISSDDCVTVEDKDETIHLRTVTTYARGIGPIRYTYFRTNAAPASHAIPSSTVELLSYHLVR